MKYYINEKYFDYINTEEKAYWLGFIFADGCIDKQRKNLIINLAIKDYEHLRRFHQSIETNRPVGYAKDNRYVYSRISNKHLVNSLILCGCIPKKSLILKFPSKDIVPEHLLKHFIRGYFDGDGCISTILRKRKNKISPTMDCEVNFLGTFDMLSNILKNLPIQPLKIFNFGKIYKFKTNNKKIIIDILDYLYQDSHIFLERKYQKYISNVKSFITKRHPLNSLIPVTTTVE